MIREQDINSSPLETLKNCVLIRSIIEKDKKINYITYKYKEYNENENIINQFMIKCKIDSINNAK